VADTKKPAKPRDGKTIWYDLHKHPDGVPGGMGKSPEHHLRQRGWNGHEINEGTGRKTIQYRNQDRPDFVISYGGGTSQKPDHNFRVLYMGTNSNIPKVHHTYSVAEAMNKVEELHGMQAGHTVMPMTAVTAATAPAEKTTTPKPSDLGSNDTAFPIGPPKVTFPTQPDREKDWAKKNQGQVKEIPDAPAPTQEGATKYGRANELARIAERLGMNIGLEEMADYEGLSSVVAALQRAERDAWEEL